MRRLLAVVLLNLVLFGAYSQSTFPAMETENLKGEFHNIPQDLEKYTLIGLAYSKKSENQLNTWYNPTYNQFIYKPDKPSLFAGNYDVDVYFIPMFTGAKRPAYQTAMKKVKAKVDARLHPHILFYKGQLKEYKKKLGFKGKDVPYFFVLDKSGKIVYRTSGNYNQQKMQQIVDAVEASWN